MPKKTEDTSSLSARFDRAASVIFIDEAAESRAQSLYANMAAPAAISPEILKRFNELIPFAPLPEKTLGALLDKTIEKRGYSLSSEDRENLLQQIVEKAKTEGARCIRSLVEQWHETKEREQRARALNFQQGIERPIPRVHPFNLPRGSQR
jgi:ATP-dependent Clp protease ATP-binding subunit ClpA